jgi:REP element-mobilizing transposase RayT
MPRQPRQKSETGIYHVIVRGIGQQEIFYDEKDMQRYLETVIKVSSENSVSILGYCLMSNHVHLLINEGGTNISSIMKRIGVSYAYWYNRKYERSGHVFQDRYKSEPVENDAYLLTVIHYIHHNPVKASLVNKPHEYKWSSCAAYYKADVQTVNYPETEIILSMFHKEKKKAIEAFRKFMEAANDNHCLEYQETKRISDTETYEIIKQMMKGKPISSLQTMGQEERSKILERLRRDYGFSLRHLSRVTGLPFHIVRKS